MKTPNLIKFDKTGNQLLDNWEILSYINDSIEFPTELFILKNYLYISESRSDLNILHSLNIEDNKFNYSCLKKGENYGDYLHAWQMNSNSSGNFCFTDFIKKVMVCYKPDELNSKKKNKKVSHYFNFDTLPVNQIVMINNKLYYHNNGPNSKNIIECADTNFTNVIGLGTLLTSENSEMAQNVHLSINDVILRTYKDKIIIGYKFAPLLEILNTKTRNFSSYIIEEKFNPKFSTARKKEEEIFVYEENVSLETITDICITDRYIYLLYDGNPWKENNYIDGYKTIYVFDHHGHPVKRYKMTKGIIKFTVYKDSILYGINFSKVKPEIIKHEIN